MRTCALCFVLVLCVVFDVLLFNKYSLITFTAAGRKSRLRHIYTVCVCRLCCSTATGTRRLSLLYMSATEMTTTTTVRNKELRKI